MRSATRCPQIEPCAGEFEGRHPAPQRGVWGSERRALLGFAEGLARQDNPQIQVLPSLGKSQLTSIYSLPIRLLQSVKIGK
jgi:hypothetical protein